MEKIWENIKTFLERNLIKLLCGAVSVTGKIIDYMHDRYKDKTKQQIEKKIENAEKKITDACDNGNIGSLFEAVDELKKAKQKEKKTCI